MRVAMTLQRASPVPLHRQIYEQWRTGILTGRFHRGERVAHQLEPVVDTLPPCQIRSTCRWFAEQGRQVCLRCPQVITRVPSDDSLGRIALTPHPDGTSERAPGQPVGDAKPPVVHQTHAGTPG